MRAYGIIKSTFWTMGSGKRLRGKPEAQVLASYLMTCSQGTMCGIFSLALPTVAHETGIPMSRIEDVFDEIRDIVIYDEEDEICWIPNSARYQIGTSLSPKDKRRPGLIRELDQVGPHPFVAEFLHLYGEAYRIGPTDLSACMPLADLMQAPRVNVARPQSRSSSRSSASTCLDQESDQVSGQDHAREAHDSDGPNDPPESAAKSKRKARPKDDSPPDPRVTPVQRHFTEVFKRRFGTDPAPSNFSRAGGLIRKLPQSVTVEMLVRAVDVQLKERYGAEYITGKDWCDLPTIVSKYDQILAWKAGGAKSRSTDYRPDPDLQETINEVWGHIPNPEAAQ